MILPSKSRVLPRFLLTNVNRVLSKMDFLRVLFSTQALQILAITESWLNEDVSDHYVNIDDCVIFRDDRNDGRVGGGVAIWTNWNLHATRFDVLSPAYGTNSVWLLFHQLHLCFVCIYIPPSVVIHSSNEVISFISENLDRVMMKYPNYEIIMTGDFNRMNVSYLLNAFDLNNTVQCPTRGDAVLDLVLISSSISDQYSTTVGPPVSTSDHNTVLSIPLMKMETDNVKKLKLYDLRDSNVEAFINLMTQMSFKTVYADSLSLDEKCNIFMGIIDHSFTHTIPVSIISMSSKDKPYISPLVKTLINQRWDAYRRRHFPLYHHLSAKIKKLIFLEKKKWAQKAKNCPTDMWNVVNELRGTKSARKSASDVLTHLFDSASEAAEQMNAMFAGYQTERPLLPSISISDCMEWQPCVTAMEVFESLRNLKPSKAAGYDGIPTVLYKKAAAVIADPLAHIINISIVSRTFPTAWKFSIISPVPKRCAPSKEDFRPISLLPVPAKICERLVLNADRSVHCQFRDTFGHNQFGGVKFSSTASALICLHDVITRALDNDGFTGVMLLAYDFSKAFDTVGHDIIMDSLIRNRFPSGFILWVRDYLSQRTQSVRVDQATSNALPVISGIPQGSVLGPYLFNSVVGSLLPSLERTSCIKYVDDCTFVIPVESDTDLSVNTEHTNMLHWTSAVGLQLNLKKSKLLWIPKASYCAPPSPPEIPLVDNLTILGVTLSSDLKWHTHTNRVHQIASRRLFAVRILRPFLSRSDLACVYKGLILSVIEYCSPLLVGMSSRDRMTMAKLQRRAHNIICGHDCSCKLFEDLNERRNKAAVKFLLNISRNVNHPLYHLCPARSSRSGNFVQPFCKTSRRRNSFFPASTILINNTPI